MISDRPPLIKVRIFGISRPPMASSLYVKVDFRKFEGALPYASEAYGVYQPLLGWRSRRGEGRLRALHRGSPEGVRTQVARGIRPEVQVDSGGSGPALDVRASRVELGKPAPATARLLPDSI